MNTEKLDVLPESFSDLIELALADLEEVERSPKYEVNMSYWHAPMESSKCAVCFAGAVMAALGADPNAMLWPSYFGPETEKKLRFLNDIRAGRCVVENPKIPFELFPVWSYDDNPEEFKLQMALIAGSLREFGL